MSSLHDPINEGSLAICTDSEGSRHDDNESNQIDDLDVSDYSYCSDNVDDEDDDDFCHTDDFIMGCVSSKEDKGGTFSSLFNIDPIQCPICFTVADSGEGLTLPGCHHSFCVDCFKTYISVQLGNGNANRIICPMPVGECGKVVDETALGDVLDEETQKRLSRCRHSAFVLSNPDYHHCPTADCTNIVYWNRTGLPIVDCFKCQRISCLKCGSSPYHTDMSCETWKQKQEEDERRRRSFMFSAGSARKVDRSRAGEETKYDYKPTDKSLEAMNIRVCRRCGSGVQLESGCLKMKCICGYRFCFKCGSENAQCDCTPAHHGFTDNVNGGGDFSGLREAKSYT